MTLHRRIQSFKDRQALDAASWDRESLFGDPMPVSFHPAGSEIFCEGDEVNCLYEVKFGCVRTYRLLDDGRRQIAAFYLPGEVFGFEADRSHHFSADAVVTTAVCSIRLATAIDLSRQILPLALRGLVRAQEHLLVLGRQNAVERVAAFLLDMSVRQGDTDLIDLPMSRSDIGDYLGLSLETVSRVLTKLKGLGMIELTTLRTVKILKPRALAAATGG
ncbi:helix-turn-helix domain-containing protein [Aminobacter sp. Piv2-1]|uniref:helix-turn-helix domain-containing protein n=1 Tax=Aminobacter sp. Piv2-1 TaxID=3031122 RepID=UPI0030ECB2EC